MAGNGWTTSDVTLWTTSNKRIHGHGFLIMGWKQGMQSVNQSLEQ